VGCAYDAHAVVASSFSVTTLSMGCGPGCTGSGMVLDIKLVEDPVERVPPFSAFVSRSELLELSN
jgi:hypothetical protein